MEQQREGEVLPVGIGMVPHIAGQLCFAAVVGAAGMWGLCWDDGFPFEGLEVCML